jgi:putative acetyltransferase
MVKFLPIKSEEDLYNVQELFKDYASSLDFKLDFQNFERELAELPGDFTLPNGYLLLAKVKNQIVGCVALRKLTKDVCEMKRLYVRPKFRKKGIGRGISIEIIEKARNIGYKLMRLDTIPSMKEAIALYSSLGFKYIKPYRYNPIQGAIFMELKL